MSRNSWILLGVAATAFVAFVVVEGGEQPFSNPGGSGILSLFRGGGSQPGAEVAGDGATPGAAAGADTPERRRAAAAAARLARKQRGKPGAPPDPELLRRMEARGGNLVATGPPREGKVGIIKQTFRAGPRGGDGTVVAGGAGESSGGGDTGETDNSDPNDCGAPRIEKTVVDLKARPDMRSSFDVPSQSFLISRGMGELFSIRGAPAFVILIPHTKRASAGAIFDDRFLVLIRGECIPDRQYVKSLLRQ